MRFKRWTRGGSVAPLFSFVALTGICRLKVASKGVMNAQAFIPTAFAPHDLARVGSQIFFQQDKSETPVYKRPIFWIFSFLGVVGSAYTAYLLYLYTNSELNDVSGVAQYYTLATAPPVSWGTLGNVTCPFGGCTPSPVLPPTPASG